MHNEFTLHSGVTFMETSTALESPTLLMYMVRPRSSMLIEVVPDSESSNFFSACIYQYNKCDIWR